MEQQLKSPSSSSSSMNLIGSQSPAIDRYNPIIRDSSRIPKQPLNPQINNIIPNPHKKQSKKKNKKIPVIIKDENVDQSKNDENNSNVVASVKKSWSCTKPGEFISPPGSTRYLLSDNKALFNNGGDGLSDLDPTRKVFTAETSGSETGKINELWDDRKNKPLPASEDQVVVLRVSLHCRGCERKMRKHISRMQGLYVSDIFQHRFCGEKGDHNRECNTDRGPFEHIEGEECSTLVSIHIIFYHTNTSKSQ